MTNFFLFIISSDLEGKGEDEATPLHYAARYCLPDKKHKGTLSPRIHRKFNHKGLKMPTTSASTSNIAELALQMKKEEKKEVHGGSLSKASSKDTLFMNLTKKRDSIGNRFFKDLPILDKKKSHSKDVPNVAAGTVPSTTGSPKETMIQYLLSKKVNVNARDSYGSTPLHYAVAKGNVDAVKEFLKHPGVDIEVGE